MASKKRPYNLSIDLYTGPSGFPPSTLYDVARPARFVTSSEFSSTGIGGVQPDGYFTMDTPFLFFPIVAFGPFEPYGLYYSTATQIAPTTGGTVQYFVLSADYFSLPGGTTYARAWVRLLPLP